MNTVNDNRLFFWHFFHQLEKELSYERWIDKYRIFLSTLEAGLITYDYEDEDELSSFRQFCKILYLQDHKHEKRFDELLEIAIKHEQEIQHNFLERSIKDNQNLRSRWVSEKKDNDRSKSTDQPHKDVNDGKSTREFEKPEALTKELEATEEKYFHAHLNTNNETNSVIKKSQKDGQHEQYLHTEEYYPATSREMAKAWQYLRRKERRGFVEQIDIPSTVLQVAKTGLLEYPVFQSNYTNRVDTLLILVDSGGSMNVFNDLSNRLILTAKKQGGHLLAPVYYFRNHPTSSLYKKANLTEPMEISSALLRCNPQFTVAFIISDAGATGRKAPERIETRYEETKYFLTILKQRAAYIIWLNPMPQHRWTGTAAEKIAADNDVTAMVPLLEQENYNFQDMIRRILKFKHK